MTGERIEIIRRTLIPFVKKELLEINYEDLGESDAKEFEKDLNEILDLAIQAQEQPTSEDCVSRKAVLETIEDCSSDGLKGIFCSYVDGERFKEYIERLPSITTKHGSCMDCKYNRSVYSRIIGYTDEYCDCGHRNEMRVAETFCCADYEKRGCEE